MQKLEIEKIGNRLELKCGSNVYSIYDPKNIFVRGYWDYLATLPILNDSKKVLLIGLGAGTISRIMFRLFKKIEVYGIDINPEIIKIGIEKFKMFNKNLKIFIQNREEFLENSNNKFDLIILDAFVGNRIPQNFLTEDFLKLVSNHLNADGIFSSNINDENLLNSLCNLANKYFKNIFILSSFCTLNKILVASDLSLIFEKIKKFDVSDFETKKWLALKS